MWKLKDKQDFMNNYLDLAKKEVELLQKILLQGGIKDGVSYGVMGRAQAHH